MFPVDCEGTSVEVVINGNGAFSAGHVAGSTQPFIPQAFDLTFEFTEAGASEPNFSEHETRLGAHELGNMFQFNRDFAADYARDLDRARALNPELQAFDTWLADHARRIALDLTSNSTVPTSAVSAA